MIITTELCNRAGAANWSELNNLAARYSRHSGCVTDNIFRHLAGDFSHLVLVGHTFVFALCSGVLQHIYYFSIVAIVKGAHYVCKMYFASDD